MSLFDKDLESVANSIKHFNALTSFVKTSIVTDLTYLLNDKKLLDKLYPILSGIQNDISKYDERTIDIMR